MGVGWHGPFQYAIATARQRTIAALACLMDHIPGVGNMTEDGKGKG